jgi:hypothetical protein
MRVYHVSKGKYAQEIWNNGVRSNPPEAQWVEKRNRMREIIDKKGNEIHKDWINRRGSVFFWSTYNRAIRYAEKFVNPAICEVNPDKEFWCIPNAQLETIFDKFCDEDKIIDDVESLVSNARLWNGQREDNIELWTNPPIDSDNIFQIYNINGDVFEV